jgi:branched-chain amino acid transport system substrate-binding protein
MNRLKRLDDLRRQMVSFLDRSAVAGFAALALLVAGEARSAISDGEVRVGLLVDMKSTYAHISGRGSAVAAQMAIDDAGASVAGRPIRFFVEDHGNDVERVKTIARRWFYEEGIDVIADVTGSPLAIAVQEVNRERQAVVFYNGVMSTELTGKACAKTGIHWMYDGYAFAKVVGGELTRRGARRWYLLTVDNAFGSNTGSELESTIRRGGGEIVGRARHALGERQYFAKLRAAVQSGADAIGLVNAGQDMIQAVRQGFDLLDVSKGRTTLAAVATTLNDIDEIKPPLAQGLKLSHSFYWNRDAESRAWSQRFFERTKAMPNDLQAGVFSALTHYFKAVAATGSDDGPTVVAKMRELPIVDPVVRNGRLREDGRMVHDIYLLEVKKPAEVREPWDYLRIVRTIPGDAAFRPLAESECPLLGR